MSSSDATSARGVTVNRQKADDVDEPSSPTTREQPLAPLLLSVLGSVCGTLVAKAVQDGEQQDAQLVRLLGAAVGAAIPPLVAVVGPYTRLRATAAVLVTAVALLVTYGGVAWSQRDEKPSDQIFPVPKAFGREERATPSPPESDEKRLCDDDQCVSWAPATLRCSASSCEEPVRVWNSGTAPVRLREIHVHSDPGSADGAFSLEDGGTCVEWALLQPGVACQVAVVPIDSVATGYLEVHQELDEDPSVVPIVRTTDDPGDGGVELALEGPVTCGSIVVGTGADGGDSLTLSATVVDNEAPDRPESVLVQLVSGGIGGIGGETPIALDGRTPVGVTITLQQGHYGQTLPMTMTVDPAVEVPETDRTDNQLEFTVRTPQGPDAGPAECSSAS